MEREARTVAGRVLMVGLPGPILDAPTAERIGALGPAGVILFARNLVGPEQTLELRSALAGLLPANPLVALDQEGGRVSRLAPWVGPTPAAADFDASRPDLARDFGAATALALRALGFNLDFAPVVDLCARDAGNGIGARSFGTDAERVSTLAGAFLDGLERQGVAGCLKHFPGLGATTIDSHLALPTDPRPLTAFDRGDLVPYARLGARAAAVMVGHGHYPALDPAWCRPATLSPRIVEGLLRDRLGYRGLVVTDDLEMGAVSGLDTDGAAAVGAIAAGCELLLYCADLGRAARAREALVARAADDAAFASRLRQAAAAVQRFAARWPPTEPDPTAWTRARERLVLAASRVSRDPGR